MMRSQPEELFVYGTLLPGQKNFRHIASLVSGHEVAKVRGRLYYIPWGFPALVESDEAGWVCGALLRFGCPVGEALEVCDHIEGYRPEDEKGSLFIRVVKKVVPEKGEPRQAWCYCLSPYWRPRLLKIAEEIVGGDWLAFCKERDRRPAPK